MNVAVRPKKPKVASCKPKDALPKMKAALFTTTGVEGLYGRTGLYEDVVERLAAMISRHREPGTEIMRFPPVMSRKDLEKHGYLKSFPNLLGCVCALHGSDNEIKAAADRHEKGGDWTASLSASDMVLAPAACYPIYPLAASRGAVPKGGLKFDVACDCFRHEPSNDLDRLQSFRMREYVCIGSAEEVDSFRASWIPKARAMADALCLTNDVAPASDPFFGRVGQVMAIAQLQQSLKFELLVPLHSHERPTACMSFNCHREHFGEVWGLHDAEGQVSHTACVAFGMDRLAVALFWIHGLDTKKWPAAVRNALSM